MICIKCPCPLKITVKKGIGCNQADYQHSDYCSLWEELNSGISHAPESICCRRDFQILSFLQASGKIEKIGDNTKLSFMLLLKDTRTSEGLLSNYKQALSKGHSLSVWCIYRFNWVIDFEDVQYKPGARQVKQSSNDSPQCCTHTTISSHFSTEASTGGAFAIQSCLENPACTQLWTNVRPKGDFSN